MTPQPQQDRCVLTRHDVQSIKDLVFVVGGNSESSAQKAIFEILANNMRRSRPAPAAPTDEQCRICSTAIRQQEREWWMLRVKAILQKTRFYDELDTALQELVQEATDGSSTPTAQERDAP